MYIMPFSNQSVVTVFIGCFSPYIERGAIISGGLFGYLLTSCKCVPSLYRSPTWKITFFFLHACLMLLPSALVVAGYISANLYRRLGGIQWGLNILVTILMFMGPLCVMWSILNTVAIAYR